MVTPDYNDEIEGIPVVPAFKFKGNYSIPDPPTLFQFGRWGREDFTVE